MNCRITRHRISVCDRFALPPRIMFHRPSSSTMATAASATMTRKWGRSVLIMAPSSDNAIRQSATPVPTTISV